MAYPIKFTFTGIILKDKTRYFISYLFQVSLIFIGCGYYSFSGSLPPHLETIAVPLFNDRTAEFGLKEELTDAVIEEFTKDNSLKIADRRQADAIIDGNILSIRDQAGAYNANEQVQDIKIYLTVKVKCEDLKKRKVMWEETLSHYGIYDPAEGIESRNEAISEAINKIAGDILNKTVSGW